MRQMLMCSCFVRNRNVVLIRERISRLLPCSFWLTFLLFVWSFSATAQVCTNSLGNPVLIEDFGQGVNRLSVGPALPAGTTSMQYVGATSRCPGTGQYVIQTYSSGCQNWLTLSDDHTGNSNGFFMLMNAATTLDTFYVHTISGLCPGSTYEFSAWIANMNANNSYVNPNITFTVEKPDHTVLGTYTTGPITFTNPIAWQKKGFFFTPPSGINTVVLRIRNNEQGVNGNNLALDDITLRPVGPNIAITAPGSINNTDTICANIPVTLTAVVDNCYPSPAYQWQTSTNGGTTWNDIAGANTATYTRSGSAAGTYLYRLAVAQAGSMVSTCQVYSSAFSITVIAIPPPVAVSIVASSTSICTGTRVDFRATPFNGGTSLAYQWKLNGVNVGINSTIYVNSTLSNGDVVTCVLTSNALCTATITATSNSIIITVSAATATPSITITGNNTICQGQPAPFTAIPSYGGSNPSYQWQINGNNVSPPDANYYFTFVGGLTTGDVVTCLMTSNSSCADGQTALSNAITMIVRPNLVPSISILPDVNSVCAGTPITFTATFANGGTAPVFQWKINFIDVVGANNATFTSSNLANGDIISCVLISNAACSAPYTTSNNITVSVYPIGLPTLTIAASTSGSICPGDTVTFTATPGTNIVAPIYQWRVNGVSVGTNDTIFTINTLVNGDVVTCLMTGSTTCNPIATVTANSITVSVINTTIPAISITGTNTICQGKDAAFIAMVINGGPTPVYQWKVNSINAGTNSNRFTSNVLINGAIINCKVTSSSTCATSSTSNDIPVVINALPNIDMGPDKIITKGTSVLVTPTITGTVRNYAWSPAASLSNDTIARPVATPATTTVYTLTIISADDCRASATTIVRVQITVLIPNTFSPNGDGVNDVWNITGLADYVGATMNIFNRYGQVVYNTYGYSKPWDGTSNGKPLAIGTYYYIIDLKTGMKPLNGSITILR